MKSERDKIGDFSLFGPAVQIYTPMHPFNAAPRRREEFGKPVWPLRGMFRTVTNQKPKFSVKLGAPRDSNEFADPE